MSPVGARPAPWFPDGAGLWTLVSPLGEELHGLDVEPLSGRDVLTLGQFQGPLHGPGQAPVQTRGAGRPHQFQTRADHTAHHCRVNTRTTELQFTGSPAAAALLYTKNNIDSAGIQAGTTGTCYYSFIHWFILKKGNNISLIRKFTFSLL